MKKGFIYLAAALFFGAGTLSNGLDPASAQTVSRGRQASPKPSPTPTPVAAPTVDPADEIIKVDTELVNLNVRVVDRNNRPVNDLLKADFRIFEDGTQQSIEFFSKSEVPTNYTLVIDNSGSLRGQIEQVIEASKILVGTNKPEDETSVIRFVSSDKIEILQNFTSKKSDINDALDNLYIEGGETAIVDAVYLAASEVSKYERSTSRDDRKRRALILVSDGEDRNSFYTQQQLFDVLRESDVQIYVVGFVRDLSSEKGFITKSPQSKAKAFLERLASETGGKAYFPNGVGELNGIARDIASELRTQYSIGYLPTNDRQDGTFRNIKVSIVDGPNQQKRIAITKTGRTADGAGKAPTLQSGTQIKNN